MRDAITISVVVAVAILFGLKMRRMKKDYDERMRFIQMKQEKQSQRFWNPCSGRYETKEF